MSKLIFPKPIFIKIGPIGGMFYDCGKKSNTLVVYAMGAPTVPDLGTWSDGPFILARGVDMFVADYIGFGRSDGVFTPKNCINTLLILFKKFKHGCMGVSFYNNSKINLKYKEVLFVGRSLGGAYVPLLPRFNKKINKLAVVSGALDQSEQGAIKGEETNDDFMREMKLGGYHHMYRGVLSKNIWQKHLNDQDNLSPMDNVKWLKNAKLFIGHGKNDTCVHFSKSVNYYHKLKVAFPNQKEKYKLKLYPHGDHGSSTSNLFIQDFLDWILK